MNPRRYPAAETPRSSATSYGRNAKFAMYEKTLPPLTR